MPVDVYSTCPPGYGPNAAEFGRGLALAARWTEAAGLRGLLIFTDNDSMDPWAAAQFIMERTARIVPLVAAQPMYMHPFTVARMICSLACLYGRPVDLNLVTGSYRPHLQALGQWLDHDDRYGRLLAYGRIVAALLHGTGGLNHSSEHYRMMAATVYPPLPAGLVPRVFVAGSSQASAAVARELDAVRLICPRAPTEYDDDPEALQPTGIRVGVIARDSSAEAWREAHNRYGYEPGREWRHERLAPDFDARRHAGCWGRSTHEPTAPEVYWSYPFRVTREFCPYLVGSYLEVGTVLARYLDMGVSTLILSAPRVEDDLHHAAEALRHAETLRSGAGRPMPELEPPLTAAEYAEQAQKPPGGR
jgi:alkanesulfonate monooxygenase